MKTFLITRWLLLSLLIFSTVSAQASTAYQVTPVAKNLGIVWGLSFLDNERLAFTQRSGEAGILHLTNGRIDWFDALPFVYDTGQGGLLDVQAAPDFANSGGLYFTYAKPQDTGAVTTLARAQLKNNRLTDWQDLLVTQSRSYRNIHFGSRIAFDNQQHVYFSIGDRGVRQNAQQLNTHAGKILRLTLDGKVPKDNPFVNTPGALPEIWSYGHRNPQGLAFDPVHQRLWDIEHGPRGGDEINLVTKGANYGWPIVSQGKEYGSGEPVGVQHRDGMADPHWVYIPSIAPSGLIVYQGDAFPELKGALISGALVLRHLNLVTLKPNGDPIAEKRWLTELKHRIRSVAQHPNGDVFVGTDAGIVYRIHPAS